MGSQDERDEQGQAQVPDLFDEAFDGTIRRVWHEERWFFSVVDVLAAVTDSAAPLQYWRDMKRRISGEGWAETQAKCLPLKLRMATPCTRERGVSQIHPFRKAGKHGH